MIRLSDERLNNIFGLSIRIFQFAGGLLGIIGLVVQLYDSKRDYKLNLLSVVIGFVFFSILIIVAFGNKRLWSTISICLFLVQTFYYSNGLDFTYEIVGGFGFFIIPKATIWEFHISLSQVALGPIPKGFPSGLGINLVSLFLGLGTLFLHYLRRSNDSGIIVKLLLLILRSAFLFLLVFISSIMSFEVRLLFLFITFFIALNYFLMPIKGWLFGILYTTGCVMTPLIMVYILSDAPYGYPFLFAIIIALIFSILYKFINTQNSKKIFIGGYFLLASVLSFWGGTNYLNAMTFRNPFTKEQFPFFVLEKENGSKINTTEWRGKTVVLDFWSSSCYLCFKQFKELENLKEFYVKKDSNVLIYAVNLIEPNESYDHPRKVMKRNRNNYTFSCLFISDTSAWNKLSISGVPALLILDKNGKIRYRGGLMTKWNEIIQNTRTVISRIKKKS